MKLTRLVRHCRGPSVVSASPPAARSRLGEVAGLTCTPHMSGWGMGYVNALHFVSCIPNPAPHVEFKGLSPIPFQFDTSPLTCVDGIMRAPSGPGFGIDPDPNWVKKAEVIKFHLDRGAFKRPAAR